MEKYIKHINSKLYVAIFDTYGIAVSISNGCYNVEKQTDALWLKLSYESRLTRPGYVPTTKEEFVDFFQKALSEITF